MSWKNILLVVWDVVSAVVVCLFFAALCMAITYFLIVGFAAFVHSDLSLFDFTSWQEFSRLFMGAILLIPCVLGLMAGAYVLDEAERRGAK